jgi:hypothetical protein
VGERIDVYTGLEGNLLGSSHFRRLRKKFTKRSEEKYILGKKGVMILNQEAQVDF